MNVKMNTVPKEIEAIIFRETEKKEKEKAKERKTRTVNYGDMKPLE